MGTMSSYSNGQFCWVDLMSREMADAKEFYGELLGWATADQDTQGGPPYALFTLNGQQVAGLGEMNAEMKEAGVPPIWNSYLAVDDLPAVTGRAAELGAQVVVPPLQVVEAGHMAVLQDPTGAHVSLWQKRQHGGAQLVNEPGCWVWNELMTRDPQAAQAFYGELFGWSFEKDDTPTGVYWTFKCSDRLAGGMMEIVPEMGEVPPNWSVYISVADVNAATARLTQLGGQVCRPPFEVSVGHISVVMDAQGAVLNLIQMTVPPDA